MNEQALKDRLQYIAKEKGIRFNECWKKLILERFLLRLSQSDHDRKFIFKGGFLLAYLIKIGRETIDLDFLLSGMEASEDEIRGVIQDIITTKPSDGFVFHFDGIELLQQPHMQYPGYRVTLSVAFGRMSDRIHIDVGTGDIVSPTSHSLHLFHYRERPLFENQISLLVYPPVTIFAEKLETVISKGSINSRMKDYHDLLLLTRDPHVIDPSELQVAIKKTFDHRGTVFELIEFSKEDFKPLDRLWKAHLNNLGSIANEMSLPKNIQAVIKEINEILPS